MQVGAEKFAQAVLSNAGEKVAVAALTAACPPLGTAVGGALFLKGLYEKAKHAEGTLKGKTQTERAYHLKMLAIQQLASVELDGSSK